MSKEVTFPQIVAISQLVLAITSEDVNELRQFYRLRHSIGAMLNPTLYRDEMKMAEKAESLVEAFWVFHATASRMRAQELEAMAAAKEREPQPVAGSQ